MDAGLTDSLVGKVARFLFGWLADCMINYLIKFSLQPREVDSVN